MNNVSKFESNAITLTSIFGKNKIFFGSIWPEYNQRVKMDSFNRELTYCIQAAVVSTMSILFLILMLATHNCSVVTVVTNIKIKDGKSHKTGKSYYNRHNMSSAVQKTPQNKPELRDHMWPWSTNTVISLWGIFIVITKNTLYGSK